MRLKPLDILIQGVRLLPILYGVLGLMEHETRGLEAVRDELTLSFAATFGGNEISVEDNQTRRGEAHLLHPEKPHTTEVPEREWVPRFRLLEVDETRHLINRGHERFRRQGESVSRDALILRHHIPPVPERNQKRVYFA